jgi:general secretion pathway protein I
MRLRPGGRIRHGFTLVEVLIALAVVAIALLALTRAATVQVQSFDGLRERTLAGWVGANVLSETRLATAMPPTTRSDGHMQFAGRDWRWTRDVQATPSPEIRRIDISVYLGESHDPSATLSGFAGMAVMP